jgi:hypothetical protein
VGNVKCEMRQGTRVTGFGSEATRFLLTALAFSHFTFPDSLFCQETAIVRGRVTLGGRSPLGGATVIAADSSNAQTTARADEKGVFRMRVKAPGKYQLAVIRVGQTPAIGPMVEVIPEDTIDADLQLPVTTSDTAARLDTARIVGTGRRPLDRLHEFESRRSSGAATRSITREDIEKRAPVSAWQMLTTVSSIKVADMGGMVVARSNRNETPPGIMGGSNRPCYMRVMIDGVMLQEQSMGSIVSSGSGGTFATNLSQLPAPSEIHGIEVFAGPASIPLKYSGMGSGKWCGLIAVWTK